jgi:hypothetical protein
MIEKKVDFFIVGWPKTASTSLNYYISQHPEIFVCPKKETYFFSDDIIKQADEQGSGHYYNTRNEKEYHALFQKGDKGKLWGEASVFYIISESAIMQIKKYNPSAKIIIIFREPTELVNSWFAYLKLHSRENLDSVLDALEAQDDRKLGNRLPPVFHSPIHLQYDKIVNMPTALNRVYSEFDRESVKLLFYEDIKEKPLDVLKETFEFLNVETNFIPDLTKKNLSRNPKNRKFKNIIDRNKTTTVEILSKLGILKSDNWLHNIYKGIFSEDKRRGKNDDSLSNKLKERYRKMVEETSEIINIDLIKKWNY